MTINEATRLLLNQLVPIYNHPEAAKIAGMVTDHLTTPGKINRVLNREKELTAEQQSLVDHYLQRLLNYEPVQYVLNEAWFCELKFYVDKNVLIPRPETEELVEWIISNCRFPIDQLRILDIGSGSGCIPVTLKRKLRKAEVWSCDISEPALAIAKRNAEESGAAVNFIQLDFLDTKQRNQLPLFDIIVSNPPYIPQKDKEQMHPNVLNYEPPEALFVPDEDPLVFYRAIAHFGKEHLAVQGSIYTEIHENLWVAATALFIANGYTTILKKDMQGKERMIKANF